MEIHDAIFMKVRDDKKNISLHYNDGFSIKLW